MSVKEGRGSGRTKRRGDAEPPGRRGPDAERDAETGGEEGEGPVRLRRRGDGGKGGD